MYEELLTEKHTANLTRPKQKSGLGDATVSFSLSTKDESDLSITIAKGREGVHLARAEMIALFRWYLREEEHIVQRRRAPLSVQFEIERYYERFKVLPMDQDRETLFAWMNTQGSISFEEFTEQWQSMTICADCGHVVGYIPDC